eukprot:4028362-Alexandrium_andersonii.AAC.1
MAFYRKFWKAFPELEGSQAAARLKFEEPAELPPNARSRRNTPEAPPPRPQPVTPSGHGKGHEHNKGDRGRGEKQGQEDIGRQGLKRAGNARLTRSTLSSASGRPVKTSAHITRQKRTRIIRNLQRPRQQGSDQSPRRARRDELAEDMRANTPSKKLARISNQRT